MKTTRETFYLVTSLTGDEAGPPGRDATLRDDDRKVRG